MHLLFLLLLRRRRLVDDDVPKRPRDTHLDPSDLDRKDRTRLCGRPARREKGQEWGLRDDQAGTCVSTDTDTDTAAGLVFVERRGVRGADLESIFVGMIV